MAASLSLIFHSAAMAEGPHGGGMGGGMGFVPGGPSPMIVAPIPAPAPPPSAPYPAFQTPRFMSDTPEFCTELMGDISYYRQRIAAPPPNVDLLVTEGERLCQIGHYRPGIMRLRTALMILRHTN